MEVAHSIRFDTFAGTGPLNCIKIIISRAARTREADTLLCSLFSTSALRIGTRCHHTTSQSQCIRHVVKRKLDTCGR